MKQPLSDPIGKTIRGIVECGERLVIAFDDGKYMVVRSDDIGSCVYLDVDFYLSQANEDAHKKLIGLGICTVEESAKALAEAKQYQDESAAHVLRQKADRLGYDIVKKEAKP